MQLGKESHMGTMDTVTLHNYLASQIPFNIIIIVAY